MKANKRRNYRHRRAIRLAHTFATHAEKVLAKALKARRGVKQARSLKERAELRLRAVQGASLLVLALVLATLSGCAGQVAQAPEGDVACEVQEQGADGVFHPVMYRTNAEVEVTTAADHSAGARCTVSSRMQCTVCTQAAGDNCTTAACIVSTGFVVANAGR